MKPYLFLKSKSNTFSLKYEPCFLDMIRESQLNIPFQTSDTLSIKDFQIYCHRRNFEFISKHYPKYLIAYNYLYFRDRFFCVNNNYSFIVESLEYFTQIQNVYISLKRFICLCKTKLRCRKFNDTTLTFEKIDFSRGGFIFQIMENDFIFTFDLCDVYNMCKNIVYFYSDFTMIFKETKNPYTNTNLTKPQLMLAYIFLRKHNRVPTLFDLFIKSNLNKYEFMSNHRATIQTIGIKQHFETAHQKLKISYFNSMIRSFYPQKIYTTEMSDDTFRCFYDIFEFMIVPFLFVCFHDEPRVVSRNTKMIKIKLGNFYRMNIKFGRKIMKRNILTGNYEVSVNENMVLNNTDL